ncbi:MAG: low specificity L-threonine aldolase [Bacteroidetes bacterium]|nr:low specificity L-threonine aldolase [Bacteroidota bacterium]
MSQVVKTFASDNYAGVHPEIMDALGRANTGHASSYGADHYTAEATALFKKLFGQQTEVFFVYNGTGANVLALSASSKTFSSVICAESAHIYVDESTAPEKFSGCRLIPVSSSNGKITPEAVLSKVQRIGDQHHPQAAVVSISQPTEYGTLYTVEEIRELANTAHQHGMVLHMDGARISNAAVSLNAEFKTFTIDAGVDVLSFGGTKNGMMFGEAILIFNTGLAKDLQFLRKQGMQLHSKMRFIAAQFTALLSNDLWRRSALQANKMAVRLSGKLSKISGFTLTQKTEVNGIFAVVPPSVIPEIQKHSFFYIWNEKTSEIRLMCSWDTSEADVDSFVEVVSNALQNH